MSILSVDRHVLCLGKYKTRFSNFAGFFFIGRENLDYVSIKDFGLLRSIVKCEFENFLG